MPTPNQKKPVRYMDFISRKPSESSDPLASRPIPRREEKPKPVKKISSVADQIPPKGTHAEKKPEPEIAVKKSEAKPLISRTPATSRDLYPENYKQETKKSSEKPAEKPTEKSKEKTAPSAPDGNKYTLGGKSPFLENYTVDKRPLSNSVPDKKTSNFEKISFLGVNEPSAESGHKNVYEKKELEKSEEKKDKKKKEKEVKIIDDSDQKKGIPIIVVILITIILGAAVGAGVYFLLPK